MLVISRKTGEGIIISEDTKITILEASKDRVKIGIDAPREVKIIREEIYDTGKQNVEAAHALSPDTIQKLMKKTISKE